MNIEQTLVSNKDKYSKSKLWDIFKNIDSFTDYNPKAESTFDNVLVLKTTLEGYKTAFHLGCNHRVCETLPRAAKAVNKALNVVKKSAGGLPKGLKQYYQPLIDIDNIKELMLEDIQLLSNTYKFDYDEQSIAKKYKKA